jgi:hypothetical protein
LELFIDLASEGVGGTAVEHAAARELMVTAALANKILGNFLDLGRKDLSGNPRRKDEAQ